MKMTISSPNTPQFHGLPTVGNFTMETSPEATVIERQETIKKLYDMGDKSPARKAFLDEFFEFMRQKGRPVTKIPVVAKLPLDLYRLYNVVQNYGGFSQVVKKRRWSQVVRALELPTSITSAAFTLRTQYLRLLYHFECEKKGLIPNFNCYEPEHFDHRMAYKNDYGRSILMYPSRRFDRRIEHMSPIPMKRPRTAENVPNREETPIERSRSSDDSILSSYQRNVEGSSIYRNQSQTDDSVNLIDLTASNHNNEKIKTIFLEKENTEIFNMKTNLNYSHRDKLQNRCSCWDCMKNYQEISRFCKFPPNLPDARFSETYANNLRPSNFQTPHFPDERYRYGKQSHCDGLSQQKSLFPKTRSGMDVNVLEQTENALVLTVVFNGRSYNGTLLSNFKHI